MHSNKKYSKPDGALSNSFRRKMAGEIPARRCKENWKRRGYLAKISKWLHTGEIHICISSANGQLRQMSS